MYLIDAEKWSGLSQTKPQNPSEPLGLMGNVHRCDAVSIPDGVFTVPDGKVLVVSDQTIENGKRLSYYQAFPEGKTVVKYTTVWMGMKFPHIKEGD